MKTQLLHVVGTVEKHGFQFPSNGKAHENEIHKNCLPFCAPLFQFPSNGKAHENFGDIADAEFQSFKFQFPSNGKAHENSESVIVTTSKKYVSIPFKRESA